MKHFQYSGTFTKKKNTLASAPDCLNQQLLVKFMICYKETGHRLLAGGEILLMGFYTQPTQTRGFGGKKKSPFNNRMVWIEPLDIPWTWNGLDSASGPSSPQRICTPWADPWIWEGWELSGAAGPSPWCCGITWTFISSSLIWSSFSLMSIVNFLHSVSSSRIRFRKDSVHSPLQGQHSTKHMK